MQCSSLTQKVTAPDAYSSPQAATLTGMTKDPKLVSEDSLYSRLLKSVALQL